jgi:tRNA threonylcarbamoyladenosine biosynthesis protein TsaE
VRLELRTATAEETRSVGEALGSILEAGDAIALTGELGAGKTTLVQGIARGLGIEDQIVSPTFTLVREYRGRLHLLHVDVYRLDRVQDVIDLGLDDEIGADGVLVVEWGDAVEALLPEQHLTVELTTGAVQEGVDGEPRTLVLTADGPVWEPRLAGLAAARGNERA